MLCLLLLETNSDRRRIEMLPLAYTNYYEYSEICRCYQYQHILGETKYSQTSIIRGTRLSAVFEAKT